MPYICRIIAISDLRSRNGYDDHQPPSKKIYKRSYSGKGQEQPRYLE
ncbi:unnamed protein product [Acanthoscelides obtectus]|uniref:Uncharacterized protein n=1 Tax=Acanthoscelides obtectus TaxID=200917 RepID=A0A9P0PNY8_ACAOB|nr:unnamed protein product [Acanthoscelides obtectus]CAK1649611.1 hypothetical protein AOBTE_LOCUS16330 [Acanthoscelides obtectus]